MDTNTTPTALPTGRKIEVTFPDGTTQSFGGKIAERATHVVIAKMAEGSADAGEWGILTKNGRLDIAEREAAKWGAMRQHFEIVQIVPVTR